MKDSSGFARRSGARVFSIYASIGLPLIAATSAWALPDTGNSAGARAEAGGLAEIVVTATRREENVDKVPVSVTALSQDAMDQKGIRDFTELVRFTPGVSLDTSGTNAISIRGISTVFHALWRAQLRGRHRAWWPDHPHRQGEHARGRIQSNARRLKRAFFHGDSESRLKNVRNVNG